MRASVESVPSESALRSMDRLGVGVWTDLFKARLTTLVLLTTLVGFYAGSEFRVEWPLMIHALLGTAFLAAGASALNQLLERSHDARMTRTRTRPLPSGKLQPETVLWIGAGLSVTGLFELAWFVNSVTALLGAATLLTYVFVYTPLKRVTSWNTLVGAVPGALPPLMGWTAARGEWSPAGWSLFGILFFWQLPHFLAIAWLYREEYARAGFVMLPQVDREGRRTGRQAAGTAAALLLMSLGPFLFHIAGVWYLGGAVLLGLGFVACAVSFAQGLTDSKARLLFYASILYLPGLLILMVADKIR